MTWQAKGDPLVFSLHVCVWFSVSTLICHFVKIVDRHTAVRNNTEIQHTHPSVSPNVNALHNRVQYQNKETDHDLIKILPVHMHSSVCMCVCVFVCV